ncbi:hypothetical protein ABZT06_50165 [Streptomyces sp. NPDC005483]|uniref:hypothetical protein n=1 Tax=Streptomyces sp. NPDC005483 TaxID=3154882 RepID=UPI0033AF1B36
MARPLHGGSADGFAIPPAGTLSSSVQRDACWLTCLLAAALAGTSLARLGPTRAAFRRFPATSTTAPGDPGGDTQHG